MAHCSSRQTRGYRRTVAIENKYCEDLWCEECGKEIQDLSEVSWLELNCMTGEYALPGKSWWSITEQSQGCFTFHSLCAVDVICGMPRPDGGTI